MFFLTFNLQVGLRHLMNIKKTLKTDLEDTEQLKEDKSVFRITKE